MIEADYSTALTLLLRYPSPTALDGPPSFVGDALLLRGNLSLITGSEIIVKYSERSPQHNTNIDQRPGKKGVSRRRATSQGLVPKSLSPSLSPSYFLQDQGGIEAVIRGAAKGAYTRGEQWGVNKALRGAVQNFQAVAATPNRAVEGSRWSLDAGKNTSQDLAKMRAGLETLKSRNKLLANLLGKAIDDLWTQQRQTPSQEKEKNVADTLSLAIAKLQFVQVYLENPSMPLTSDEEPAPPVSEAPQSTKASEAADHNEKHTRGKAQDRDQQVPDTPTHKPIHRAAPPNVELSGTNAIAQDAPRITLSAPAPKAPLAKLPSLSHSQRPSISQSSFSWILGPDTDTTPKNSLKKDAAISELPFTTSPPSSAQRRGARERAAYLFGDVPTFDENGRTRGHSAGGKERRQKGGKEGEDDSVKLEKLTGGKRTEGSPGSGGEVET